MPRQTRNVEGVIQPIMKVWINVWAAWWKAELGGEILFVVRHFEIFEGGNWVRMLSGFWDLSSAGPLLLVPLGECHISLSSYQLLIFYDEVETFPVNTMQPCFSSKVLKPACSVLSSFQTGLLYQGVWVLPQPMTSLEEHSLELAPGFILLSLAPKQQKMQFLDW